MSGEPLLRHAAATVHGRYLVRPQAAGAPERWLVGFHGYAHSAAIFLPMLGEVRGSGAWRVVAVQALHPFYAGRSQQVVANWMTREDRELAIADNIAYVDAVLDALAGEFGAPRAIVFAGFSQGVAMAYRAARRGRHACAGLLAVGGDVPPDVRDDTGGEWPPVLAMTGARDEWYTPARLEEDMRFVRRHRPDARSLVFDGGHEWTAAVGEAGGDLLTVAGGGA